MERRFRHMQPMPGAVTIWDVRRLLFVRLKHPRAPIALIFVLINWTEPKVPVIGAKCEFTSNDQ